MRQRFAPSATCPHRAACRRRRRSRRPMAWRIDVVLKVVSTCRVVPGVGPDAPPAAGISPSRCPLGCRVRRAGPGWGRSRLGGCGGVRDRILRKVGQRRRATLEARTVPGRYRPLRSAAHHARLATTAWDLGRSPKLADLEQCRHAHLFGYGVASPPSPSGTRQLSPRCARCGRLCPTPGRRRGTELRFRPALRRLGLRRPHRGLPSRGVGRRRAIAP
jgi:hypothetical protein